MKNYYTDYCVYRDGNSFCVCELGKDRKIYSSRIYKFQTKEECLAYIKNKFNDERFRSYEREMTNDLKKFSLFSRAH